MGAGAGAPGCGQRCVRATSDVFAEWFTACSRKVVGSDFIGLPQVRVTFGWSEGVLAG